MYQLGFGPEPAFVVESVDDTWEDLIGARTDAELVKSYICHKTRQLFDPPTNSAMLTALNNVIAELEWRISIL